MESKSGGDLSTQQTRPAGKMQVHTAVSASAGQKIKRHFIDEPQRSARREWCQCLSRGPRLDEAVVLLVFAFTEPHSDNNYRTRRTATMDSNAVIRDRDQHGKRQTRAMKRI